jgi:hypothetical protein
LNEIGDDYENVSKIYSEVSKISTQSRLTIGRAEVVQALIDLIQADLARAYRLSTTQREEELPNLPRPDEMEELYFWATAKGRDLQVSDQSWWPFDEDGALRKDWSPPKP